MVKVQFTKKVKPWYYFFYTLSVSGVGMHRTQFTIWILFFHQIFMCFSFFIMFRYEYINILVVFFFFCFKQKREVVDSNKFNNPLCLKHLSFSKENYVWAMILLLSTCVAQQVCRKACVSGNSWKNNMQQLYHRVFVQELQQMTMYPDKFA